MSTRWAGGGHGASQAGDVAASGVIDTPGGDSMVEANDLVRDYPTGGQVVHALRGLDLPVFRVTLCDKRYFHSR